MGLTRRRRCSRRSRTRRKTRRMRGGGLGSMTIPKEAVIPRNPGQLERGLGGVGE